MNFEHKYGSTKFLYEKHLNTIQGKKFTLREIDVLSCLINNRGDKKIADILSITPKTVSVHVQNVMRKFNCNSRDQIIDCTEIAGVIGYLREYYLHLLYQNHFNHLLAKLSKKLKIKEQYFSVNSSEANICEDSLYQTIKDYASILNYTFVDSSKSESQNLSKFPIEMIKENNYCEDFLQCLLKVAKTTKEKDALSSAMSDFKKFNQSLHRCKGIEKPILEKKSFSLKFIVTSVTILLILSLSLIYILLNNYYSQNRLNLDNPHIVNNLEEFLRVVNNRDFTADNTTKDKLNKNYYLINQIEKLYYNNSSTLILEYFINQSDSPEVFLNYLHKMHALSSYYMNYKHDGQQSQQILLQTKQLIEDYINNKSLSPCNFDELSPDEILSELSIVKQLPEIYTRILYSLGRTYIYLEEPEQGVKYFELAKKIGSELSLFETYLSDISGLLRIEKERAINYIKLEKTYKAIPILEDIAQSYENLKNDNKEYIKDFTPGNEVQEKIIPSIVPYNIVYCSEMTISSYNTLLEIVKENDARLYYIKKIESNVQHLLNNDGYILKNDICTRKISSLLNHLAKTYFLFHKLSLKANNLDNVVKSVFKITSIDALDISESLYTKSAQICRNTDYTKADAYKGLISIHQERLKILDDNDGKISFLHIQNEKSKLYNKINTLNKKANDINYHLNRNQKNKMN